LRDKDVAAAPLREIKVMHRLNQFLAGEDGTTAVEYAVMLALIIAVCITAVASVGSTNDGSLKDSMNRLGAIMGS
jgi:pilus assembly protein Flp/PilA